LSFTIVYNYHRWPEPPAMMVSSFLAASSLRTVENHGKRDFRQMPRIPWFCKDAMLLPKKP